MQIVDSSLGSLVGAQGVTDDPSATLVGGAETPLGGRRSIAQGNAPQANRVTEVVMQPPVFKPWIDTISPEVEKWLESQGLNRYGDPLGTSYMGGTPNFDESSGRYRWESDPLWSSELPGYGFSNTLPPYLIGMPGSSGCEGQRSVEQSSRMGDGLNTVMKKIEELRAEVRKIWDALMRCGNRPKLRKLLLNRLKVLEKIILLISMMMGGKRVSAESSSSSDNRVHSSGDSSPMVVPGTGAVAAPSVPSIPSTPPTSPTTT